MTIEAMKQALEALETCAEDEWYTDDDYGMMQTYDEKKVWEAITTLRAAIERMEYDGIHTCHAECQRPACVAVREAVQREREACAQLALQGIGEAVQTRTLEILQSERQRIAAAIRARGQT
jgi:hypothetical protein